MWSWGGGWRMEKLGPGLLPAMDLRNAVAHAGREQRGVSSPQGQGDKAAVGAVTTGTWRASGGRGGGSGVGWLLAQAVGVWVPPPMQVSVCPLPAPGQVSIPQPLAQGGLDLWGAGIWGLRCRSLTSQKLLKIRISVAQIQLKSQTNHPNHLPRH